MARQGREWSAQMVAADVRRIIRDADYELLVTCTSTWGRELAGGQQEASKAQVRRIFGEIKQIEMKWHHDERVSLERLRMLKPRLAYAAARPNVGPGVRRLRDVLDPGVDAVIEAENARSRFERFRTFVRLTEALLAYFTAARGGGEDGIRAPIGRQGRRPERP